ncbi:MAG: amidohydrolase family protein [Chloroflexi bacterium]|nr:amidohydrolase family protein [Chloroflexota bacterium]MDA1146715.1 amidohydrolase family protein [Chloroflexota bacterium]
MVAEPTSLELRGGRVWDGTADAASDATVFSADGLISGSAAAGAAVLDVAGCTVVPGLIEAHTHLCFNSGADWREVYDSDTPEQMLLRMAGAAHRMLEAGITTVRDLGAPTHLAVELRNAIRSGLVAGPDLLVAGAPITPTGGHCWFMGGEADGIDGVKVAVRERKKAGVDWIKVMASGGNMTPGTNVFAAQFTVEELRAIVAEAHRLEMKVTAHAHGIEGIKVAVAAPVDMIEHCSFQTLEGSVKDDSVILDIARRGIGVSPTITSGFVNFRGQPRWEMRAELTKSLIAAGCNVLMSTDSGIPNAPHENLAQAMAVVQELSGLSSIATMKLATSTSAKHLGLPDRGTIATGQRADLLVVEGDPTQDITALQRVRAVVSGGVLAYQAR